MVGRWNFLLKWYLFRGHVNFFLGGGLTTMIEGAELWLFGDWIHWNLRAATSGSDLHHGCGWWGGYTRWQWEPGVAKRYNGLNCVATFNKKYKTCDIFFFVFLPRQADKKNPVCRIHNFWLVKFFPARSLLCPTLPNWTPWWQWWML